MKKNHRYVGPNHRYENRYTVGKITGMKKNHRYENIFQFRGLKKNHRSETQIQVQNPNGGTKEKITGQLDPGCIWANPGCKNKCPFLEQPCPY